MVAGAAKLAPLAGLVMLTDGKALRAAAAWPANAKSRIANSTRNEQRVGGHAGRRFIVLLLGQDGRLIII
jgi:hypothetical protein